MTNLTQAYIFEKMREKEEEIAKIYYIAPDNMIFKEVKEECIKIWGKFDDTYTYATNKINRIKDLGNIKDNMMSMVAMFDHNNRGILLNNLSEEAKEFIIKRF